MALERLDNSTSEDMVVLRRKRRIGQDLMPVGGPETELRMLDCVNG